MAWFLSDCVAFGRERMGLLFLDTAFFSYRILAMVLLQINIVSVLIAPQIFLCT